MPKLAISGYYVPVYEHSRFARTQYVHCDEWEKTDIRSWWSWFFTPLVKLFE